MLGVKWGYGSPVTASYNLPRGDETTTLPEAYLAALRSPGKESGYYLVLLPLLDRQVGESSIAEAAISLKLKPEDLSRSIAAAQPLPLARIPAADEAAAIAERLRGLGLESVIISHDDLHLELSSTQIRALECSDDSVTAVTTVGRARISSSWDESTLLVAGRLLSNRVEVEERSRRGRKQTVDSRELSTDDSVLDIYSRTEVANWRIAAGAFDFSCLGPAKGVTTFQNFTALIDFLRERAAGAKLDDSYMRVRPLLESVWPLEQQINKGAMRRRGSGRFDAATVTTTDNEGQFTRYSRLRYCLRLIEPKDTK